MTEVRRRSVGFPRKDVGGSSGHSSPLTDESYSVNKADQAAGFCASESTMHDASLHKLIDLWSELSPSTVGSTCGL